MNNHNNTISVIIPLYNAVKTLEKCIRSIQLQKGVELEIICVDDGSTDNTLELCKKIKGNDPRISIVTKENGGVASARNRGLELAKGQYVTFVDQDDWIEDNAYSIILSNLEKQAVDLVVFNFFKDYEHNIQKMENRSIINSLITDKNDLVKYTFFREEYRGFTLYVWNKVFRRDFLLQNNIRFDGTLRRGDDVLLWAKVIASGPKAVYVDRHLYHYVQRDDSVSHTNTRYREVLIGYQKAIQCLEEADISLSALSYMKCFYAYHASNLLELSIKENKEDKAYYKKELERYLEEYLHQNRNYKDRLERVNNLLEME